MSSTPEEVEVRTASLESEVSTLTRATKVWDEQCKMVTERLDADADAAAAAVAGLCASPCPDTVPPGDVTVCLGGLARAAEAAARNRKRPREAAAPEAAEAPVPPDDASPFRDTTLLADLARAAKEAAPDSRRPRGAAAAGTFRARVPQGYSSKFYGVHYMPTSNTWNSSYYGGNGKVVYVGSFRDEEKAGRAYNAAIAEDGGVRCKPNLVGADGRLRPKPAASSPYFGVSWYKRLKRWKAAVCRQRRLGFDGKMTTLGYYDDAIAAAKAADAYLRSYMPSIAATKTNFPTAEEWGACAPGSPSLPRAATARAPPPPPPPPELVVGTAVAFPRPMLGIRLEFDADARAIRFDACTSPDSPAAAAGLAAGLVLAAINGAAVAAVESRAEYDATIDAIRAAPRPITLLFQEHFFVDDRAPKRFSWA
jgi:hypothetical protein